MKKDLLADEGYVYKVGAIGVRYESPRVLWRALFVPHAAFEVDSFN